jgi:hypothetical protein
MNKTQLKIEKGITYLIEIMNFELPKGIFNKGIAGCGATTLAIEDNNKTIICSPRNALLKNKKNQHPNCMLVIEGVNVEEVRQYIKQTEIPKILVSYDSLYKVIDCIEDKSK